jgi:hypothetical protein
MSHEDFKPDDIFINRVKAHPDLNFFIYESVVTINRHQNLSGSNDYVLNVPRGHLSLYEMNINRAGSTGFNNDVEASGSKGLIFPYVYNSGQTVKHTFRNRMDAILGHRTSTDYCNNLSLLPEFGEIVSGSYPMSASIKRILSAKTSSWTGCAAWTTAVGTQTYATGVNLYMSALVQTAKKYTPLSKHFCFQGTLAESASGTQNLSRDLTTMDNVNIINIPQIFYGTEVKKGSVRLKYYVTGTLVGECADTKRNGELIETTGSSTGTVVGLVMYDEGLMILTASHALGDNTNIQYGTGGGVANQWIYFGAGCNDGITTSGTDHLASASFDISCKGTSYTNRMTLFCHAHKNKLDYSNNPTFIDISGSGAKAHSFTTSSYSYSEPPLLLKNVVSSSFVNHSASYEKTTYLSKIGIYDEHGNLIMVASMAKPAKKTIQDEYTFKLTLDI